MNKDLIEKIIKEKFSFETDYGTKTSVEEIRIDDDMSVAEMISVEVKFNRLSFVDVEKIYELSKTLLSVRTRVFAGDGENLWAAFWVRPEDYNQTKGD